MHSEDSKILDRITEAALRLYSSRPRSKLSIQDIAQAAGVSRGTIYNHFDSLDQLLSLVANKVVEEMNDLTSLDTALERDPAVITALRIRMYMQKYSEDPGWGRMILDYGVNHPGLIENKQAPIYKDIQRGILIGRFKIEERLLPMAAFMAAGATFAAMKLVEKKEKTWQEASSEVNELLLISLGIDASEAKWIAENTLPKHETKNRQ